MGNFSSRLTGKRNGNIKILKFFFVEICWRWKGFAQSKRSRIKIFIKIFLALFLFWKILYYKFKKRVILHKYIYFSNELFIDYIFSKKEFQKSLDESSKVGKTWIYILKNFQDIYLLFLKYQTSQVDFQWTNSQKIPKLHLRMIKSFSQNSLKNKSYFLVNIDKNSNDIINRIELWIDNCAN